MNKKIWIVISMVILVAVIAAAGVRIALAQVPGSWHGFGRGGWMGNQVVAAQRMGYGWHGQEGDDAWMEGMHSWMHDDSGMHAVVWDSLAESLGLTSAELYAEIENGKTIAELAEAQGISLEDLAADLEVAHRDSLGEAVAEGYLTQEAADEMLEHMSGQYGWMLDNMGAGWMYGGMHGYGGGWMMDGSNDEKGCHGQWGDGDSSRPQPKP